MFSIHNNILADRAFYINLPSSTDRKDNVDSQISQYEINDIERFEAIKDPLHQASATKSHIKIFEESSKQGYESICVLEDDFQIKDDVFILDQNNKISLVEYLPILSEHLSQIDWDVVLLGFNGKKPCIPISPHLSKNFKSTGAWAYLINKKTYEYILNHFNYYGDRLAIDDILPYLTYKGFRSYATNTQIIHHGVGFISTLQPSLGPINYSEWILGNYHRTIWHSLNSFTDFFTSLDDIYNTTNFIRENIILLNKFNGDITQLINFMQSNSLYSTCFSEIVANYNLPGVGYYLSVESPYLIHTPNTRNEIVDLGSNFIEIDL